jgi:uncharacterized protein DUF5076
MANFDALNVPPSAIEKGGNELMRVAVADGELYMSIRRGFDDPEAWGRVIAEIAKHVSQIYATETKYNKLEAAQRILDAFAKDMAGGEAGSPFLGAKN